MKKQSSKRITRAHRDALIMKRIGISAMALCVCLVTGAIWETAHAASSAHNFVEKASIGNQFEIESSKLALQQSQNQDVKSLAQEMVDDHTKVGQQMKKVVSANDADDAQPTVSLDTKHQKMLDALRAAKGDDFDKLYVDDQMKAHKEAISLFTSYSKDGDNAALKDFAGKTLPQLQHHEDDVTQLQKSM